MSAKVTENLLSDLVDCGDVPLDQVPDDAEFRQMLRRIGIVEGGDGTLVSAFNSSI
jgi:hypothetical protein